MDKITVFTPTYNRRKLINRVFESLKSQTCKDFIWLIVDDGSNDNTKETIEKLKNDCEMKIEYYYQENGGKHRAYNYAVSKCKTDYLLILDSDDTLEKNSIEILNKYISIIEKDELISGIIGNRFDRKSGKVIGKYMPDVYCASGIELYQKYKFVGDTLRVYKTKILKKFLFPEIENEKFMYENVVFDKIDKEYKMLIIHEKLYIGEYLEDGYTKNAKKLKINNPKGYALSLRSSAETAILLKKKVNLYILYIIWCKKLNIDIDIDNKIIYYLLAPISILLQKIKIPKFFFNLFETDGDKFYE